MIGTGLGPSLLLEKLIELGDDYILDKNNRRSSESASVIRKFYHDIALTKEGHRYFNNDIALEKHKPDDSEIVFGGCLYTPPEHYNVYSPIEGIVRNYINLEVRKYLGLSIKEYLGLTYNQMELYDKVLVELKTQIEKHEEEQEKKMNEVSKSVGKDRGKK